MNIEPKVATDAELRRLRQRLNRNFTGNMLMCTDELERLLNRVEKKEPT